MYASIQERRAMGYSKRKTALELEIDKKTVRKYWDMGEEEYVQCVLEAKSRAKILDPYRDFIADKLEKHPEITSAIIEDKLREKFKEEFPGSGRAVRLYVAALREELGLFKPIQIRQHCAVAETPLGFQAQVDMGQKTMTDMYGKRIKIYIFAMVMSASRMKFIYFQDKPFTAQTFIVAHDLAFRYFGGRTEEIVYDQDRVMTVSENAGDMLFTEAFENYSKYAGFSIRLCRGHDPQSKGKIERVIGYVKNNFLACREYQGLPQLNSEGLAWLDRTANAKIHETTKMIPKHVFIQEQKELKPVPTLSQPTLPREAIVRKDNVVHYLQNRYAVPRGTYRPGRKTRIEANDEGSMVSFYDAETGEHLATHTVYCGKGKLISLPQNAERFQNTKAQELKAKVLQGLDGVNGAGEYIDAIAAKYPRYIRDQLSIVHKMLGLHTKPELQKAMDYCLGRGLISANDFRDTLAYFRQLQPTVSFNETIMLPVKYSIIRAEIRPVDVYSVAFSNTEGGDNV